MRFIEDETWQDIKANFPIAFDHFHGSKDEQRIIMSAGVPHRWADDFCDDETDFDGEEWDDRHLYNYFDSEGIKVLVFYSKEKRTFGYTICFDGRGSFSCDEMYGKRTEAEQSAFFQAFDSHNSILKNA